MTKLLSDMDFDTSHAEEIADLLKGHKDILTPITKKHHEYLNSQSCDSCGTQLHLTMSPNPFHSNNIMPSFVGGCHNCKTEGIVIPNPSFIKGSSLGQSDLPRKEVGDSGDK